MPKDTRERFDLGRGVSIDVEHTLPENRLENLAVSLAEAYNRKNLAEKDADAFDKQEYNERVKAGNMTTVIFQLKERAREDAQREAQGLPPIKRLRMDPLEDYDLEACTAERRQAIDRAQEFRAKADTFREIAKMAERKIPQIQRRIQEAQEFARKAG